MHPLPNPASTLYCNPDASALTSRIARMRNPAAAIIARYTLRQEGQAPYVTSQSAS
ncbi:hypothetical protein C7378_1617 [Acidipila rosea]|uniref:Uncharacterized protein n=1 Tax=Acidipila rosea TaxID=768535 RepID=A0A4R1L9I1_9BACT|nr:hypothetical protein C7378_1617 [Acidipila rosea]